MMSASSSCSLDLELENIFDGASEEEEEALVAVSALVASASSEPDPNDGMAPVHSGRPSGSKSFSRTCSWYEDYLAAAPRYPGYKFREIFRVPIKLYHVIKKKLEQEVPDLSQKVDALGRPGHASDQKILCGLRRLGQPSSYRERDDGAGMSPESQRQYFHHFVHGMIETFGPRYFNREPSTDELRRIVAEYEEVGFPGCRGCVGCMHLKWKNCPLELKGQYHNSKNGKLATISCEAVVDHGLYCWSWFAGRAGTNNDLTVMQNSPFFTALLMGQRPLRLPERYFVNGEARDWPLYLLADGIYGDWAIFQKPISSPADEKESHLTQRQESVRKDVERFNGCLQGRFKILRQESFEFDAEFIVSISNCCVILHNMLVELRLSGEC